MECRRRTNTDKRRAVAKLIDDETCGILVEPIQGEGGINIAPDGYLEGLRALADKQPRPQLFREIGTGPPRREAGHVGVGPGSEGERVHGEPNVYRMCPVPQGHYGRLVTGS